MPVQESRPEPVLLVQFDMVKSSSWDIPPQLEVRLLAHIRKRLKGLGDAYDYTEFSFQGDGGCYLRSIENAARDYDDLVSFSVAIQREIEIISVDPMINPLRVPLRARVSCHSCSIIASDDHMAPPSGKELSWFIKNERSLGSEDSVTITEDVYNHLTTPISRGAFVKIKAIPRARGEMALFRLYPSRLPGEFADTGQFARNRHVACEEKQAVANYVVEHFLTGTANVFLDAGSSVFYVALCIEDRSRREARTWEHLRIYTTSLANWHTLRTVRDRELELKLVGDEFNESLQAFMVPSDLVDRVAPSVSIIGLDGIDTDGIWYGDSSDLYPLRLQMATRPVKHFRLLIADERKIGRSLGQRLCSLEELFEQPGDARSIVVTSRPTAPVSSAYEEVRTLIRERYGEDAFREIPMMTAR